MCLSVYWRWPFSSSSAARRTVALSSSADREAAIFRCARVICFPESRWSAERATTLFFPSGLYSGRASCGSLRNFPTCDEKMNSRQWAHWYKARRWWRGYIASRRQMPSCVSSSSLYSLCELALRVNNCLTIGNAYRVAELEGSNEREGEAGIK